MPTVPAHIRYFQEVVQCQSISLAAKRLRIATSAISRQIRKIEREIDGALFERHARGMRLTPEGEIYASYARDSIFQSQRVDSELASLRGLNRGHVTIFAVEGAVGSVLAQALVTFNKRFPEVTFELVVAGSDDVHVAVVKGAADIGVAFSPPSHPKVSTLRKFKDPLCAVMSPKSPLAKSRRLDLKTVLSYPHAFPAQAFGIRIRYLIDLAYKRSRLSPRPTFTANRLDALKNFALNNGGLALLPRLSVMRELRNGTLVAVPIENPLFRDSTIEICVLTQRRLPIAAETFLTLLPEKL